MDNIISYDNKIAVYQNSALSPEANVTARYGNHYEVSGSGGSNHGYPQITFAVKCKEGGTPTGSGVCSMSAMAPYVGGWTYDEDAALGWSGNVIELGIDLTIQYCNVENVPTGESAKILFGVGHYRHLYGNTYIIAGPDGPDIWRPDYHISTAGFYTETGYGPYTYTQHFDYTAITPNSTQVITVSAGGGSNSAFRVFQCYTADYDYRRYK